MKGFEVMDIQKNKNVGNDISFSGNKKPVEKKEAKPQEPKTGDLSVQLDAIAASQRALVNKVSFKGIKEELYEEFPLPMDPCASDWAEVSRQERAMHNLNCKRVQLAIMSGMSSKDYKAFKANHYHKPTNRETYAMYELRNVFGIRDTDTLRPFRSFPDDSSSVEDIHSYIDHDDNIKRQFLKTHFDTEKMEKLGISVEKLVSGSMGEIVERFEKDPVFRSCNTSMQKYFYYVYDESNAT